MSTVIAVLRDNPLLLLFVVAAIGYPLGRVKLGGTSLGIAAVLFTGLAFGALDPNLKLPEEVTMLGLVLFVYTIGLASGSIFFASLGGKGLRYNLLVAGGLALAAVLAGLAARVFLLNGRLTAGMFAGSLTNTPALAGVIEHITATGTQEPALSEPVIAYSLTYPIGVLGMILTLYLFQKIWKVNYYVEARRQRDVDSGIDPLRSQTVSITQDSGLSVAELIRRNHWNIVFGRLRRDGHILLVTGQTVLKAGDLVTLVGTEEALETVNRSLGGAPSAEHLEFDLSKFERLRMFISNPQVAGRKLRDLDIIARYGALITRIRRGDVEMIPRGETVLMPGDQVRVIGPREKMDELARLLGNSYRAVSEIDILTFSLGVALGMLLGMVPIPLPGGLTLRLGMAGGPLVTALVFGGLGRTGPFVWTIPLGANLTLRQIGLVFFLAGIGTRAGYSFVSMLVEGSGVVILLSGLLVTILTTAAVVLVGYRLMHIPFGLLLGILAGLQTQPAVLGFGLEQTENDLPNIGYATVFPLAIILKIILAQVLLILFLN